jgi:hypothetical protein
MAGTGDAEFGGLRFELRELYFARAGNGSYRCFYLAARGEITTARKGNFERIGIQR